LWPGRNFRKFSKKFEQLSEGRASSDEECIHKLLEEKIKKINERCERNFLQNVSEKLLETF